MRSSEHIDSDSTFIRLFCPEGLDLLPQNKLWERVQIIRSAPGGGKTTLLRAFTPNVLNTLYESQSNEDYKMLFNKMKQLDVITEDGPNLLGIVLSCSRNYATLEDLDCNPVQKERLLYALLNARIILATLRNVLILKKMNYPNDLHRITFEINIDAFPADIETPCTGRQLYEWARSVEKSVSDIMDRFGPIERKPIQGHDTLFSLEMITPDHISIDGNPLKCRVLIMFDDVHQLSLNQRRKLIQTVIEARPVVSVWLAERLEALAPDELLASGVIAGREYERPINMEEYWRNVHNKRFEKAMIDIADRRARSARDIPIVSFDACLQESLDGAKWNQVFQQTIDTCEKRIMDKKGNSKKYDDWIRSKEIEEGTLRQQAIGWRTLEILIERDLNKSQLSFDFDNILSLDELEHRDNSSAQAAAELYLAEEFNIPYYYGISRVTSIASYNIEQFLDFSGELFEEIIASTLLKRQQSLDPSRQEAIQKKVAQQRWDDIIRRIPNGRGVQNFLLAIKDLANEEWDKGTASYGGGGGITGIGITMVDRDKMVKSDSNYQHAMYKNLNTILSLCISNHLLEVTLGLKQGGKSWMILYLNRWLCLQFGLPLQYGGWKSIKPKELINWVDKGYRLSDKNGGSLFDEG
ncbi:hypothetical protein [Desulfitobacterium sp.]|uniref:ORC-CDC6 family AAA ATPase n=1 Tax=Desulfitobacterium sp. TaxID=49981 RepID=UPI003BB996BA